MYIMTMFIIIIKYDYDIKWPNVLFLITINVENSCAA